MISIIIPSKNRLEFLDNLLIDIFAQTLLPVEIIVVDQSALPYSLPNDKKIVHILDKEQGPCHARNLGLSVCKGEIIVFLDDDIRIDKEFLNVLTKPMIENGCPVVVGAVCNHEGEYKHLSAAERFTNGRNWLITMTSNPDSPGSCFTFSFPAGCAAIKREVFETLGGFDTFFDPEGSGEDREYAIRIIKAGYPIRYEGSAKINHLGAEVGGRRDSRSKYSRLNALDANCAYIVLKHFNQELFEQYCQNWFKHLLPKGEVNIVQWGRAFMRIKEAKDFIKTLKNAVDGPGNKYQK